MGKPIGPQGSKELHHNGNFPGKRDRNGLAGVGGDPTDTFRERGQDIDFPLGTKGKSGQPNEVLGVEEREPVSAEGVASGRR